MKKTLFSILFSLALAASLAGCGGAASSTAAARASYSSMDSAPQAYAADAGGTAAEAAGTSDLSDAVQNSADLLRQDGRKIILNATLSIEALDFNATCTALARAAQSCGGYVSSTSIDTPAYEGAYRTAYYQFRIPAEQYSVFLDGAGSAGNLVSKQESTQDVTSAYVDVEARLKSLKLQEERLYAMMEHDDLISYSTVDVTVEEVKQITEKTETFGDRVSDAFRRSWRDFGYGAQDFAVGFVAALPTLLVLAVLAAVAVTAARAAVRLHKKRLAGRPAPAPRTPAGYAPQNGNEAETGKDAPPSTPPKYK